MIREIGDDSLGRWDGESDPQCDHCQQPLPKEDAVELDGEAIMEVCENFAAGGYQVTWEKLDAADYGVPQHRERVIVIGKRSLVDDLSNVPDIRDLF